MPVATISVVFPHSIGRDFTVATNTEHEALNAGATAWPRPLPTDGGPNRRDCDTKYCIVGAAFVA